MDVHELLLKVQNKEIDLNTAEEYLKKLPYEDLGLPSWTIIGRCVPVLAKSFIAREKRPTI